MANPASATVTRNLTVNASTTQILASLVLSGDREVGVKNLSTGEDMSYGTYTYTPGTTIKLRALPLYSSYGFDYYSVSGNCTYSLVNHFDITITLNSGTTYVAAHGILDDD